MRKFFKLPGPLKRLLVQSTFLLVSTQLILKWLPFQSVRRLLSRFEKPAAHFQSSKRAEKQEIIWAVSTASRQLFGADYCLPEALVAHVLLSRGGLSSRLRIGVRKDDPGGLKAHAWVESDGLIVVGALGSGLEAYTPLHDLNETGA